MMGGGVCAQQQPKLHHSHHFYLPNKIDFLSKFLANNNFDNDGDDLYSSDHFRMYEFKVQKCSRSRSHDWTDCPFAHPGEKARRRDPRKYHYSGTVCADFRKCHGGKGDNCEFSHGGFECWLHPSRYRTEACKDGQNCKRKVCFFAHSSRQLRIVSDTKEMQNQGCCAYCHNTTKLSPPASMSYEEAVIELMASLEAMNHLNFGVSQSGGGRGGSKLWGGDGELGLSGPDLGWINDLLT